MTLGFGNTLLGKPSHDAIVKLQDYEIKLLEVLKKTLSLRIKYDRDYAHSLTQLALQSSKIESPSYDSPLYQAWKEIIHEVTEVAQCIKRGADTLHSSTSEKVNGLIKDKIAIKKNYVENRERLDNELLKTIHTDMDKKHNLYMKTETEVSNAHHNYDAAVAKKNNKVNAIEKAQDKYRKTTMKLHNYHNDYLLHVNEAQMYQQHYRSSLLPELLNGLQYMEVQFADTLKNILTEYLCNTSPCREEMVSSHKRSEDKLRNVDSNAEYSSFMKCQEAVLEPEAVIKFEALTGEGSNLPAGQVFLNSLSLQGLEHLAHGYKDDLEVIQGQIDDHNQRLNDLEEEIRQISENLDNLSKHFPTEQIGLMMKKQEYMKVKLDLIEQENLLIRQKHLHNLVNRSLEELGDKDPPPALSFPELDTTSLGPPSSSVSNLTSPGVEKTAASKMFNFVGKKLTSKFQISAKAKSNETKPVLFDLNRDVREQVWFHGAIPRAEAVRLLPSDGDFLVRESSNKPGEMVLSSRCEGQIRHFMIQMTDVGFYRFEGDPYASVVELVHHHFSTKIPVTRKTNCILLNPICKDKWQLTHDDVDILERLGAGNFGTVHKGYMKSTNEYVAVKTCKDTVDSSTKDKFLMEAKILKGYDHPNVVKLIGVCTDRQPIYIIMELVTGGDLAEYVKKQKSQLTQRHLVQLCRDACAGLSYLEKKNCIHRDVAARNCLVSEDSTVKITDFGMSREEDDGVYTVSGTMKSVPMRWTAPEAMDYGKFTSASDVWSFGILSWEVFAFGQQPYPRMTNQKARDSVATGYRMPQQSTCPDRYYNEVMLPSWNSDADRRPHFSDLIVTIDSILKQL